MLHGKILISIHRPDGGYQPSIRDQYKDLTLILSELFEESHMSLALEYIGKSKLAGLVGMSTLHHTDKDYEPYYNTSDDGANYRTAHGFNYHQVRVLN